MGLLTFAVLALLLLRFALAPFDLRFELTLHSMLLTDVQRRSFYGALVLGRHTVFVQWWPRAITAPKRVNGNLVWDNNQLVYEQVQPFFTYGIRVSGAQVRA